MQHKEMDSWVTMTWMTENPHRQNSLRFSCTSRRSASGVQETGGGARGLNPHVDQPWSHWSTMVLVLVLILSCELLRWSFVMVSS